MSLKNIVFKQLSSRRKEYLNNWKKTERDSNREKYNQYNRDYYSSTGKNKKKEYHESPKGRFDSYKQNAKKRDIEFCLTFEQFVNYWNSKCSYCGEEINGIGLDRINNNLGYIDGNVTPCCYSCNWMKRDMTKEEFLQKCRKILSFCG